MVPWNSPPGKVYTETEKSQWGTDAEAETKQLVNLQGNGKKAWQPRENPGLTDGTSRLLS